MTITKLPPTRWQEYKALRLEAVADTPQSFTTTIAETEQEADAVWQEKIQNVFFALGEDNHPIGMAAYFNESKEKLSHVAHVVSVYVSPSFRNQGVGTALIKTLINDARSKPNLRKMQLEVMTTETAARTMYQSVGFKVVGERKRVLRVGQTFYDEYLMELLFD